MCPKLASYGVVVEAVTWERVQRQQQWTQSCRSWGGSWRMAFLRQGTRWGTQGFFKVCDNLSMAQGVVMYKDRVVVPRVLRREILEGLHAGHQGVVSMRARAANCVFWPEIDQAIQYVRNRCRTCDYIALS